MNRLSYFIEDVTDLAAEMKYLFRRFFYDHTQFQLERWRHWMEKEIDHGDCPTKVAPKAKKDAEWRCPHGVLFRAQKTFGSTELKWVPRKEEK